jgi:hypothetical protein
MIYEKLQKARVELQNKKIKKSLLFANFLNLIRSAGERREDFLTSSIIASAKFSFSKLRTTGVGCSSWL